MIFGKGIALNLGIENIFINDSDLNTFIEYVSNKAESENLTQNIKFSNLSTKFSLLVLIFRNYII